MRKIKSLKDTIPYAKLYNQLKQFHQDKRGFSKGGFVMGGLSMDDGTPVNGFSPQFYQSELAQMVADDANSLLQNQLDKAKLSLKTPYDVKENATSMDTLGELFSVFNEEAEKSNPIPNSYEPNLRSDELSFDEMFKGKEELPQMFSGKKQGWLELSSNFIKDKEKFREDAYEDKTMKNGKLVTVRYVAGFGSSTTTKKDGTVIKIKKGMKVTNEEAIRDLNRRITKEFVPIIKNTIGKDTWENLIDNQKSAIVSITYKYGRVPKRIRQAIKSGAPIVGANAIRKLATDNDGINKDRRLEEASMFEGATSSLMSRTGSK